MSPSLSRDASYLKTSRINRLPAYLCIQLVRFFYKEKEKVSAKVLKDIKFPLVLDMYDMCTSEMQKKLATTRDAFMLQEKDEANRVKVKKIAAANDKPTATTTTTTASENKEEKVYVPYSFEDDQGSNSSGYYDLIGVLTHKGRSSNSGHYVGWSKHPSTQQWYMFDDDTVVKSSEEDILKLSGGGDWHTAYVLFYGPRRLEKKFADMARDQQQQSAASTDTTTTTTATTNANATTSTSTTAP